MSEHESSDGERRHSPLDPTPFSSTPPRRDEHHEALDGAVSRDELDSQPTEEQIQERLGESQIGCPDADAPGEIYFVVDDNQLPEEDLIWRLLPLAVHQVREQLRVLGKLGGDGVETEYWQSTPEFEAIAEYIYHSQRSS